MKYINIILFIISCTFYFILTMIIPYTVSGTKELSFIFILATVCIMLFVYSLKGDNRKKYLWLYFIAYFLALLGFVFSENRSSMATSTRVISYGVNLIPFKSIINLLHSWAGIKFGLYNIIGNFLMLTPLAIFLPYLWDKFKSLKVFSLSIILISIIIEFFQFVFNIGAFDVDDIILNFCGCIILFGLLKKDIFNNFVQKLFITWKVKNKIVNVIYYILVIISLGICIAMTDTIVTYIRSNVVNMYYLKCVDNKQAFIGNIGNYHYYSKCDYGTERNIYVGNIKYSLFEFLINDENRYEKYKNDLGLSRERIVTKVDVEKSDNTKPALVYEFNSRYVDRTEYYYYIGIDKIKVYYDNKNEEYFNIFKRMKDSGYNPLEYDSINIQEALLNIKKAYVDYDSASTMTIFENESFNAVMCCYNIFEKSDTRMYFISKDYKITNNFCKDIG